MSQHGFSDDGAYWWDGQVWRQTSPDRRSYFDGATWHPIPGPAVSPPPAAGTMLAPNKKKRHTGLWVLGGVGALILLIIVASVAASSGGSKSKTSSSTTAATASPTLAAAAAPKAAAKPACTAPCANADGWIVQVSDFKYGADSGNEFEKPEAGNVYVTVDVTFINHTRQEQNANPTTFVLQDANGIKHTVTFTDRCQVFNPVNLTTGSQLGPKCIAFEATAGKPSPLTLVWTPQLFGGSDHPIKLS
jgi:Domain of unknown function (DUF4352)